MKAIKTGDMQKLLQGVVAGVNECVAVGGNEFGFALPGDDASMVVVLLRPVDDAKTLLDAIADAREEAGLVSRRGQMIVGTAETPKEG